MPTRTALLVLLSGRGPSSPPTTTRSSFVTLQPTQHGGQVPGDASDSSDFYGLGAAVLAIALIIVIAKVTFRNRRPIESRERGD